MKNLPVLSFVLYSTFIAIQGTCPQSCSVPITIYNDLKCQPEYANPSDCCPTRYDCSQIFNRTSETCHFKGKLYKAGEKIEYEDAPGSCDRECSCEPSPEKSQFVCPLLMDGCAEEWVGDYPKPTCYLRHALNACCAVGEICPPFDNLAKCEVNGKTYKEGELFDHPAHKCKKCVCSKDFNGNFESPYCEEVQCYAEIHNSGAIDNNCAPYYKSLDSCCPEKWVCPNKSGRFIPAPNQQNNSDSLKCKFGKETVAIRGKYETETPEDGKLYCECLIPPLLTCTLEPFKG